MNVRRTIILMVMVAGHALAQSPRPSLNEVSLQLNKSLPGIYDHATKLNSTTVENNHFYYHFVVNADKKEFAYAFPKVRAQIMSTICSRARERGILRDYKANIVYRYESVKGLSLGEFMIRHEHCSK